MRARWNTLVRAVRHACFSMTKCCYRLRRDVITLPHARVIIRRSNTRSRDRFDAFQHLGLAYTSCGGVSFVNQRFIRVMKLISDKRKDRVKPCVAICFRSSFALSGVVYYVLFLNPHSLFSSSASWRFEMATSIQCAHKKSKCYTCGLCSLCPECACVSTEKGSAHLPVFFSTQRSK